eukprot:1195313-Prorocentrum_minimum.AAC.7
MLCPAVRITRQAEQLFCVTGYIYLQNSWVMGYGLCGWCTGQGQYCTVSSAGIACRWMGVQDRDNTVPSAAQELLVVGWVWAL